MKERAAFLVEPWQPDPYIEILSASKKCILENKCMLLMASNMMSNNETSSLSS